MKNSTWLNMASAHANTQSKSISKFHTVMKTNYPSIISFITQKTQDVTFNNYNQQQQYHHEPVAPIVFSMIDLMKQWYILTFPSTINFSSY